MCSYEIKKFYDFLKAKSNKPIVFNANMRPTLLYYYIIITYTKGITLPSVLSVL